MGELVGEPEVQRGFGDNLRTVRKAVGLTQERLGQLADVHRTYVTAMERGKTSPTIWTVVRLAYGLDVEPGKLVEGLRPRPRPYGAQPTRPAPAKSRRKMEA